MLTYRQCIRDGIKYHIYGTNPCAHIKVELVLPFKLYKWVKSGIIDHMLMLKPEVLSHIRHYHQANVQVFYQHSWLPDDDLGKETFHTILRNLTDLLIANSETTDHQLDPEFNVCLELFSVNPDVRYTNFCEDKILDNHFAKTGFICLHRLKDDIYGKATSIAIQDLPHRACPRPDLEPCKLGIEPLNWLYINPELINYLCQSKLSSACEVYEYVQSEETTDLVVTAHSKEDFCVIKTEEADFPLRVRSALLRFTLN